MQPPLIEIKNLRKAFKGQDVLRGVNLSVPEGMITTIIGKSGEGKSVLLKHIIGLLTPDSGEILFQGTELTRLKKAKRRELKRSFSYMFQNMALFDSMTVADNIALPLRENTGMAEQDIAGRVAEKIERLELGRVAGKYPSQLSGGMQKRVALARALITEPKIVLFDEPTTGLDPIRKNAVLKLIADSREDFGFTAVLVSHDIPDVFGISGRVAMLDAGRIVFEGTPQEAIQASEGPLARFIRGQDEEEAFEGQTSGGQAA
mgnify:CR=1 FL=1